MSNQSFRCSAVVPAAGVGRRFGSAVPKQYLALHGATVIEHTIRLLLSIEQIGRIVVLVAPGDERWQQLSILRHHRVCVAVGGDERAHSVLNGLRQLADAEDPSDLVLVHDVARPCCPRVDIERLIHAVADHLVGGLLATPVSDTLKRGGGSVVIETVDRTSLWAALTPQLFRRGLLRRALESCLAQGHLVTDEAQAVERLGLQPLLVEGSRRNIKITRPEDLDLAGFYLAQQPKEA